MRHFPAPLVLGFVWLGLILFPATGADQQKKKETKEADKTDITAEVRLMNSKDYQSPPTTFRPGHVKARQLDPKSVKQTADGFLIQLPSKAPVPTPTVYQGKIYVSGGFHSKEYYCFDAQTGKLVWAVDLDDDGPTSAVCEDGVVIFNTESCTIFALDAESGKHLWSYFLGDPLTSTPTIANGKVFTSYPAAGRGGAPSNAVPPNSKQKPKTQAPGVQQAPPAQAKPEQPAPAKRPNASHVLACFELRTGKILWQRWIDSDVMSAPVAVDGDVFATSFGGTVYKFKQADGVILSAHRLRATSAPVVVGKSVYMTQRADMGAGGRVSEKIAGVDRDSNKTQLESAAKDAKYLDDRVQAQSELKKKGQALDASNGFAGGAPAAANPHAAAMNVGQANVSTMQAFQGSRILHSYGANFNCMGDEVCCTNPANGKLVWSIKLKGDLAKVGGHLAAPPAAAGGSVFLAMLSGEVVRLDPKKGKVHETYKVGFPIRSQPAIVNGRIYVGTMDGKVACINTGNPQFTGWTTWGGNAAHTNTAESPK